MCLGKQKQTQDVMINYPSMPYLPSCERGEAHLRTVVSTDGPCFERGEVEVPPHMLDDLRRAGRVHGRYPRHESLGARMAITRNEEKSAFFSFRCIVSKLQSKVVDFEKVNHAYCCFFDEVSEAAKLCSITQANVQI